MSNPSLLLSDLIPGAAVSDALAFYARFITYVLKGSSLQPTYYKKMIRPQIRINSGFQFPTITDEITHREDTINLSYGLGWGILKIPFGVGFFKEGRHDYWRN